MEESKVVKTKKIKTVIQAEEEHLSSVSTKKVSRKKSSTKTIVESISSEPKLDAVPETGTKTETETETVNAMETDGPLESTKKTNGVKKTKSKSKKQKMAETDTQNISVKKSFSKFDELQKKNLIHSTQNEKDNSCSICEKPVYKMEEVKAEKKIFHRNCFRCKECNKLLKLDNYQCHESVLYCQNHFKMLFAPKVNAEDDKPQPRKAELIILENEPEELPPDVVRASSKPDLGLEELQQLNVRSRFEIFENANKKKPEEQESNEEQKKPAAVLEKKGSIVAKLAKLRQQGCFVGENLDAIDGVELEQSDEEKSADSDSDEDIDLARSKKCTQKERPIGIGDAMNDIKSRFEKGHIMTKEERREERKQEIQNIRSRLFMGKQARIKEMYQQAVADAEHGKPATGDKTPNIEISCAAKTIKDRFEKGHIFKQTDSEEGNEENLRNGHINEDADVFESAISKKSRSIFMELDANLAANKTNNTFVKSRSSQSSKRLNSETEHEENYVDVVRYDSQPEDVKIETSEVSQKFKFFETFRPAPVDKKQFRITPPREGVVKLPSPEAKEEDTDQRKSANIDNILQKSQTTSKMLSMFREMEQNKSNGRLRNEGPRPLKCFTPPPDGEKRIYNDPESDYESEDDAGDENDSSDKDSGHNLYENDSSLKEAQLAARAKLLRDKFEKWQSMQHEDNDDSHEEIYSQQVLDSSIESTKTLRDRFENMNKMPEIVHSKSRCQVNRFI